MFSWTVSLAALVWLMCAVNADDKEVDICLQPLQTQICRAAIPSWYFDAKESACKEFIYGGCPGVNNRFPSREACIRRCNPEVCKLLPVTGPCRAHIPSWFYHSATSVCNQFVYGGCAGNDNRFGSKHRCEQACAGTNQTCEWGETFDSIGEQSVHLSYREREWFLSRCLSRCKRACLNTHSWGECLAYSTRNRRRGCYCYLYDRALSTEEFDPNSRGKTKNRACITQD